MTLKEILLRSCKSDNYSQEYVSKMYEEIGEDNFWKIYLSIKAAESAICREASINPPSPKNILDVHVMGLLDENSITY